MRYIKRMIKRILLSVKHRDCCFYGTATIDSKFEGGNYIGYNSDFSGKMGYASYIGNNCIVSANIGRYSCIGNNVQTISATHPLSPFVSIHPAFFSIRKQTCESFTEKQLFDEFIYADSEKKVAAIIGSDVWVGNNVLIKGGVTIGDGAIIAAGAIVTKDIEPYSIATGIPAKVIKKRFSENEILFLKELLWWKKPKSWLKKHASAFTDIEELMNEINGKPSNL